MISWEFVLMLSTETFKFVQRIIIIICNKNEYYYGDTVKFEAECGEGNY